MCSSAASLILSLSLALSLTVVLSKLNFCSSAPPRRGKSAMPMCSMEQKRCISVASREGDEGGKGKKERSERENMEMTSWVEALKIFTPLLPPPFPSLAPSLPPPSLPSSIFHRCLMSSGEAHLRRRRPVSQRSALRRMISYGLMMVPAGWLADWKCTTLTRTHAALVM